VAYAEYGCVRFAEVIELNAPPPIPLRPRRRPVPLAITASQPALEAAAAGVVLG